MYYYFFFFKEKVDNPISLDFMPSRKQRVNLLLVVAFWGGGETIRLKSLSLDIFPVWIFNAAWPSLNGKYWLNFVVTALRSPLTVSINGYSICALWRSCQTSTKLTLQYEKNTRVIKLLQNQFTVYKEQELSNRLTLQYEKNTGVMKLLQSQHWRLDLGANYAPSFSIIFYSS